ncbi:MAG: hypothetical protein IPI76_09975 [Chloracidobacterium sp.]|nr:hypothetical protein [Chloracidobacterium sp.]
MSAPTIKLALLTVTMVAVTLMCTGESSAQSVSRIRFARGAMRAIAVGSLNGYKDRRTFVIKVRSGQTMTTAQVGGLPITVTIIKPDGEEYDADMDLSCHNRHEVTPTEAGDYRLVVTECTKADRWRGKFKLAVTVR